MFNFFIDCVILILLFYALVSISEKLLRFAVKNEHVGISYAVITPQETETLEYDIRQSAQLCLKNGFPLIILDTGLSDDARYIINALSNEFSNILVASCDEFTPKILNQKY